MNLYEIASEYRQQLTLLADLDMPPEAVQDTIESISGDLQGKLRACVAYSLELDILAVGASEAARRMADRAKTLQGRADALRAYTLKAMQDCGIPDIATDEWAAKIAKTPAAVKIENQAAIPPLYWRTPEPPPAAPDKTAIKKAIQAGETVPGAALVGGFRLAIK